jgi:hypothetical protein
MNKVNAPCKIKIAGYVKLAKLWERSRDDAIAYHRTYYEDKFAGSAQFELVDVYIDITGQKEICHRPEMLRLIRDCSCGKVECIATQTIGYLAANVGEFSFLIKKLFDMSPSIEIITEDEAYNINTLADKDNQREALYKMASEFVAFDPKAYQHWKDKVAKGMSKIAIE